MKAFDPLPGLFGEKKRGGTSAGLGAQGKKQAGGAEPGCKRPRMKKWIG